MIQILIHLSSHRSRQNNTFRIIFKIQTVEVNGLVCAICLIAVNLNVTSSSHGTADSPIPTLNKYKMKTSMD